MPESKLTEAEALAAEMDPRDRLITALAEQVTRANQRIITLSDRT